MPLTADRFSPAELVQNLDLLALAIALPVFIALGAPLLGYLVVGAAWVAGRVAKAEADRRRDRALQHGNRNAALGLTAFAMLGRLWVLAACILVVGLIEREAGLAGAILAAALVTAHLLGSFAEQVLNGEGSGTGGSI